MLIGAIMDLHMKIGTIYSEECAEKRVFERKISLHNTFDHLIQAKK